MELLPVWLEQRPNSQPTPSPQSVSTFPSSLRKQIFSPNFQNTVLVITKNSLVQHHLVLRRRGRDGGRGHGAGGGKTGRRDGQPFPFV